MNTFFTRLSFELCYVEKRWTRKMEDFMSENDFWPEVLRLVSGVQLEEYFTPLCLLNEIRRKCVDYLSFIDKEEKKRVPYEFVPWNESLEEFYISTEEISSYVSGFDLDFVESGAFEACCGSYCCEDYFNIFNAEHLLASYFAFHALYCYEDISFYQDQCFLRMMDAPIFKEALREAMKRFGFFQIYQDAEKSPVFRKRHKFDFTDEPVSLERPENLPFDLLFKMMSHATPFDIDKLLSRIMHIYKNKQDRKKIYDLLYERLVMQLPDFGDNMDAFSRYCDFIQKLFLHLEEIVKELDNTDDKPQLEYVSPPKEVKPIVPPVEIKKKKKISLEEVLFSAIKDLFSSQQIRGYKFKQTYWRAIYEVWTQYKSDAKQVDFVNMLRAQFGEKEKEWSLPKTANNISKGGQKMYDANSVYDQIKQYMTKRMTFYVAKYSK